MSLTGLKNVGRMGYQCGCGGAGFGGYYEDLLASSLGEDSVVSGWLVVRVEIGGK